MVEKNYYIHIKYVKLLTQAQYEVNYKIYYSNCIINKTLWIYRVQKWHHANDMDLYHI